MTRCFFFLRLGHCFRSRLADASPTFRTYMALACSYVTGCLRKTKSIVTLQFNSKGPLTHVSIQLHCHQLHGEIYINAAHYCVLNTSEIALTVLNVELIGILENVKYVSSHYDGH